MLTMKKKPASDYEAMLQAADEQMNGYTTERDQARERIASARREQEQMAGRLATRAQERGILSRQLAQATTSMQEAQAYAFVANGQAAMAAAATVNERQAQVNALQERQARIQEQHSHEEADESVRFSALQDTIQKDEQRIRELAPKITALGATKERIRQQWGEALYAELDKELTEVESRVQEADEHAKAARNALVQAKAQATERIAAWPTLKRQLMHAHATSEDATTKALTAALGFLDILIAEGAAIDTRAAAMPGCYSFLQEMVMSQADMLALGSGNLEHMRAKRDHLLTLLQQYRANLTRR